MTTDIRKGFTSASNAAADALCAGRFIAQRGIPEARSADADSGKAVHDALATSDPSELTIDQRDIFESCKKIEAELVAAVFGEKAPVVAFREQRYWGKVELPRINKLSAPTVLEHSGQADVVYRSGVRALVIDYKTLQGDVEDSPKNLQLRDLACLARGHFVVVSEVATAILQPLVTHKPEVCMYEAADLQRAEQEMWARVAASNRPDAKRVASELACKFCLAKSVCREYAAWAGSQLPIPQGDLFTVAMQSWTPEQRAKIAAALTPAGKILDEIKEFLKDGLVKDANFIPGWSLQPGNKREVINNPQACFERFAAIGGTIGQFMGAITVGKTKLKEAVHGVSGSVGKALDGEVAKLTDGIMDVSNNAPSLKRTEGK